MYKFFIILINILYLLILTFREEENKMKDEKSIKDGSMTTTKTPSLNNACLYELKVMDGYVKGEEVVRDRFKELVRNKDRQMQEIRDRNALLPGSDLPGFIPLR